MENESGARPRARPHQQQSPKYGLHASCIVWNSVFVDVGFYFELSKKNWLKSRTLYVWCEEMYISGKNLPQNEEIVGCKSMCLFFFLKCEFFLGYIEAEAAMPAKYYLMDFSVKWRWQYPPILLCFFLAEWFSVKGGGVLPNFT